MTEFALVLPILLFLLLAIVQFGVVFNNYVTLTDAVRAGARKGAVARRLSISVRRDRDAGAERRHRPQGLRTCRSRSPRPSCRDPTSRSPPRTPTTSKCSASESSRSGRLHSTMTERVE